MRLLTPEEQALWEQSTGRPYVPPAQSRTSFSNPFQGKSISDFIPNVLEGKSVTDFIPNVFGRTAPANYQGLLSAGILTPEQVAQTQKTANIQGLLGAGLALAQGMSRTGARRSGAQNILSALGAGFGASGGAYQQGLQDFSTQQQLSAAKLQKEKAMQDRAAIERALQDPRIANDPVLVAYIRANPNEALKMLAEDLPLREAMATPQAQAPAPSQVSAGIVEGQGIPLPQVDVTAKDLQARIFEQKNRLIDENMRLSRLTGERAQKKVKQNNEQIAELDKQLDRGAISGFNFAELENTLPPQFKPEIDAIKQLSELGVLSGSDLTQRIQSLQTRAAEATNYTNQPRRVAAAMFGGKAINELTPPELMQLENKLYEMDIAARQAGATSITLPSESERTAGFLTNRVVNSLNQLQRVVGANPTAASPKFGSEAIKFLTGSDYLKNLANPEARQQVEAAQLEILDAALTLGTGAAYTRDQLENYRKSYFPQLGDKSETIKDKQQRLQSLLDSAMIKSGRAAPTTPSGVAPAFDMNAIEQELNRRKGR
jgi:hypothetical protein